MWRSEPRVYNIFGLVFGQSLRLVMAGLALGLAVSLALTRLLATFLYGTATTDTAHPGGGLPACWWRSPCLAGYVPARKAAGVDPLTALRAD